MTSREEVAAEGNPQRRSSFRFTERPCSLRPCSLRPSLRSARQLWRKREPADTEVTATWPSRRERPERTLPG